MNKLFDEYGIKARLVPAVLCSLPFIVIKHYIIDYFLPEDVTRQFYQVAIEDVSLTVGLTYLFAQLSRFISKALFERKREFPTVLMLLPSSKVVSAEYRKKIETKIQTDFQMSLPTSTDEVQDLEGAKTRISEIISLIIHKVGPGKLLLQHNIEYGFMRNLIGGSVFAALVSGLSAIYFKLVLNEQTGFAVALTLAVVYSVPVILSRSILKNYSKAYASILFREYVG